MIGVEFVKLDERAVPPSQAYDGDAGWDLHVLDDTFIPQGEGVDVRTGLAMALPAGYFARIVGRSSALRRKGLLVVEGIIDSGFRGELFSFVYNPGVRGAQERRTERVPMRMQGGQPAEGVRTREGIWLREGQSVAQVIIQDVQPVQWTWVDTLPGSARGTAGFGSSGR